MWRYNYVNTTELYHYGIPGMKWGQRIASKWNDHFDKRRVKLEEKYRKQGMSKKDAQIRAEKSVKGEKVTTGVASAVGTAALGYAAYRLLRGKKSNKPAKGAIETAKETIIKNTETNGKDAIKKAKETVIKNTKTKSKNSKAKDRSRGSQIPSRQTYLTYPAFHIKISSLITSCEYIPWKGDSETNACLTRQ